MIGSILIGEDNLISQQVMEALLDGKCQKVKAVASYEELMSELNSDRYDLLLLDYHLDQDADFIVARIRQQESRNKNLSIFILSAEPERVVLDRMQGLTISGYIKKPIDPASLDAVLKNTSSISLEKKSVHKSGIDLSHLEMLLGNRPDSVKRIVNIFRAEAMDNGHQMRQLLANKDWQSLKSIVHRTRASYGYLGLEDLQEQLKLWETDIEAKQNYDQYERILKRIEVETADVLKKLEEIYPSIP